MKNYCSIFLILFISTTFFGQVGLETTSPEATLHIAGEKSTVRIDAFNVDNNPLNDGIKLAPTYVEKNGEITLSPSGNGIGSIFIIDASPTFSVTEIATNNNAPKTITNIYNYEIILPAEAFIEVKYSLSYNIFSTYNPINQTGVKILDGQARQIKTYFTIDEEVSKYGQISQNYYNISTGGGPGTFYNNGFAYISLPPGTYTLKFYADIAGHSNNTTAVVFGGDESLLRIRFYQ